MDEKKRRPLKRTPTLRLITCMNFGILRDDLGVFIWRSASEDDLRALAMIWFLRTLVGRFLFERAYVFWKEKMAI